MLLETKRPGWQPRARKEQLTHMHGRAVPPGLSTPPLLSDPALSATDRLVGLTLQVLGGVVGSVTATLAQLQEATTLCRRSVQVSLATLEARGYLARVAAFPGGPVSYAIKGGAPHAPHGNLDEWGVHHMHPPTKEGVHHMHPPTPDAPPYTTCTPLNEPVTIDDNATEPPENTIPAAVLVFPTPPAEGVHHMHPPTGEVECATLNHPSPPPGPLPIPASSPESLETLVQDKTGEPESEAEKVPVAPPVLRPALIDGEPVVYPLINGQSWALPESLLARYLKRWAGKVNVVEALLAAQDWAIDHPARRKTSRGMSGYLTRWLGRAARQAAEEAAAPRGKRRGKPDMHVGGRPATPGVEDNGLALAVLAEKVRQTEAATEGVRRVLDDVARTIEGMPWLAPAGTTQRHLGELEEHALTAILAALPREDVEAMKREASTAAGKGTTPEVTERARKILLIHQVRETLGLPRFELG